MENAYNLWCQNCNCSKEKSNVSTMFHIQMSDEESKIPLVCPDAVADENEHTLKVLGMKSFGSISKFSGSRLSLSDKQTMLKKRATEHYKKEIEPIKKEMWKDSGIGQK